MTDFGLQTERVDRIVAHRGLTVDSTMPTIMP